MIPKKEITANKRKIKNLLQSTGREGIESLLFWLDTTDFYTAPASTQHHGNFEGGLAKHSLLVYESFLEKLTQYQSTLGKESAIICGIGHDMCKINLYILNLKKDGNPSKKPYKVTDIFPYGHGEKSVMMLEKHIRLTEPEALIIRWHMGMYDKEWENYAEKVLKICPDTLLFQHADHEVSKIIGV